MGTWLSANGGPLALVIVGLGVGGFTNRWAGLSLAFIGVVMFVVQQWRRRFVRPGSRVVPPTTQAPPPELVSESHREELRSLLAGLDAHVRNDQCSLIRGSSLEALRAHYPAIADMRRDWNQMVSRKADSAERLLVRITNELKAIDSSNTFNMAILPSGIRNLVILQLLEPSRKPLSRMNIWKFFRIASEPVNGVYFQGYPGERAIELPVVAGESPSAQRAFETLAHKAIDPVEAVRIAATAWPEARQYVDAAGALEAFDREPLLSQIEQQNMRERVRVAADCPICGTIG